MQLDLPTPIDMYFLSEKTDGTEMTSQIFAIDAVVEDESAVHRGLSAIKAWKTSGKEATGYTVDPRSVHHDADRTIVTAEVVGRFPGSPLTLNYAFTLNDERVVKLEIH